MNRIVIICEGETEQEFCKTILYPYFLGKNIIIEFPKIKKTGGGIVAWEILKKEIENYLKNERKIIVTTFIDYYGTHSKHHFPNWEERLERKDKLERVKYVEEGMKLDIEDDIRYRFIPYIQLHEFEGLLLVNEEIFLQQIPTKDLLNYSDLVSVIQSHPNPELINDGKTTAPSKRMEKWISGYNKPLYGAILAEAIGLENIRKKCLRFNEWIEKLENAF
jgi:hypothetical protein